MIDYSRPTLRNFFAGMTPDSRPCKPGTCPIQAAYRLPTCGAAVGCDPSLAGAIDRYLKRAHGGDVTWELLTAGEIVQVIDDLDAAEARFTAAQGVRI